MITKCNIFTIKITLICSLFWTTVTYGQAAKVVDTCWMIEKSFDEFESETTFKTPYYKELFPNSSPGSSTESFYPSTMIKVKKGSSITYYLSMNTRGLTYTTSRKGAFIIFEDGSKFYKPSEEIDMDPKGEGYTYSCFIRLSITDVKLFATKRIKKFKLYIYDDVYDSVLADEFRHNVGCLINAK